MSSFDKANNMESRNKFDKQEEPNIQRPLSVDQITYPTGYPDIQEVRRMSRDRAPIPPQPTHHFFISTQFESLDYENIMNQLEIENDKMNSFKNLMREDTLRIIYFVVAGLITAVINTVLEIAISKLGIAKFEFLSNYFMKVYEYGSIREVLLLIAGWFPAIVIPVMIGSMLVVCIAPFAAGGGVAQCVAYLNGVKVPNVLNMKGLVIKLLSTTCTCISGLAGGREGPMMHIGAVVGGSLPSLFSYQVFKSDHERRDLAAAGFGAGIAVAFGAPVGGLLLALEEGVSFWNIRLMWRTYLCIVMAHFTSIVLMSYEYGNFGNTSNPDFLAFGKISKNVTVYEFVEIGFFIIIGAIGGLLGAAITSIHIRMTIFRRKYIHTSARKLIESFFLACITTVVSVLAIVCFKNCSLQLLKTQICSEDFYFEFDTGYNEVTLASFFSGSHSHQLYCLFNGTEVIKSNNTNITFTSDMSVLLIDTQEAVIHSLFQPLEMHISSLFAFSCLYFVLVCLTMGLSISAGIFVPQIMLGAAWGRLFGTILKQILPKSEWARPEKYAYLGATAQLSGTVGKTFSILVIMIEASNSINFSFPLMVIVSVAKWVETLFVMPIYETQMHMMGIPFLPSQSPPVNVVLLTSRVMSAPPIVTLPTKPTVQMIVETLKSCTHNGFPVVGKTDSSTGDVLVGLILRQQLLVLLKYNAYKYPPPQTPRQMGQCRDVYLKEARKTLTLEKIAVDKNYYTTEMDLTPYFNCFPYTVKETMPLINTYQLFRSLGLRHIIVINDKNEPIAVVTRKDLAKFHASEILCKKKVKELQIKP